jgi:methanogenic corrinoid protein MtbC1
MIGDAPVTQTVADQIGAHKYASSAASTAELAKNFVGVA